MEPVSVDAKPKGRKGSLENPEVVENVPGHVIPIIEREFDDFDTEARKFLDGQTRRGPVHRLPAQAGRLRPAPGGRPDDPREAAVRRRLPRADGVLRRPRRAVHAAEEGPHHHAAELPVPPRPARRRGQGDPHDQRDRALQPRGVRQHRAQRDRRPVGRRVRGRAVRPHPLRRRVRALLRAQRGLPAAAAQVQGRLHRHRRGPRDHEHPRPRLRPAHPRDRRPAGQGLRDPHRRRHVDHAARRRALLGVRDRRRRRVPEDLRGGAAHLRPPGAAAREPRPRPDQVPDRQGRHRGVPAHGRRGARGRLGQRARLQPGPAAVRRQRAGQGARSAVGLRQRQRRRERVRRVRRLERAAAAPGRLLDGRGEGHARRPHARAVPRPRADHARVHRRLRAHHRAPEPPAALGARRERLRRVAAPQGARPRRRRRAPDRRRRELPRHRQLQARHHQLDGPQPGRAAAPRGDADRRPAHASRST